MKIAKLGDCHVGVRGGNIFFRQFIKDWLLNYFIPKCVEEGVELIIQYGDFFDVRKSLYGLDKEWIETEFIPACREAGIPWKMLTGNHDIQLRHSNRSHHTSIFTEMASDIFTVYSQVPEEVEIDGDVHLFIPWINEDGHEGSNYQASVQAIKDSEAKYAHGHLELAGFPISSASMAEHGIVEEELFDKFDRTDTGHYHKRSKRRAIEYIGTPYPLTWDDHGDERGFCIWDSETNEQTFIENDPSMTLFSIMRYDWGLFKDDEDLRKAVVDHERVEKAISGRLVKIVVTNNEDTRHYNKFVEAVRRAGAIDVQWVDNTITSLSDVEVDEEALHLDTEATLNEYIESQEMSVSATDVIAVSNEILKEVQDGTVA